MKRPKEMIMANWTMKDNTNGKNGGYYRIYRDGVRVLDSFPYGKDTDPEFVKHWTEIVVATMNDAVNNWRTLTAGRRERMMDRDLIKAGAIYRTPAGARYRVVTKDGQNLTIQNVSDKHSEEIFECSLGRFAARAVAEVLGTSEP
jgi:hypothetical protein